MTNYITEKIHIDDGAFYLKTKGLVAYCFIDHIIKTTSNKPKHVVLVDDNEAFLAQVSYAMLALRINFTGIHYTQGESRGDKVKRVLTDDTIAQIKEIKTRHTWSPERWHDEPADEPVDCPHGLLLINSSIFEALHKNH